MTSSPATPVEPQACDRSSFTSSSVHCASSLHVLPPVAALRIPVERDPPNYTASPKRLLILHGPLPFRRYRPRRPRLRQRRALSHSVGILFFGLARRSNLDIKRLTLHLGNSHRLAPSAVSEQSTLHARPAGNGRMTDTHASCITAPTRCISVMNRSTSSSTDAIADNVSFVPARASMARLTRLVLCERGAAQLLAEYLGDDAPDGDAERVDVVVRLRLSDDTYSSLVSCMHAGFATHQWRQMAYERDSPSGAYQRLPIFHALRIDVMQEHVRRCELVVL